MSIDKIADIAEEREFTPKELEEILRSGPTRDDREPWEEEIDYSDDDWPHYPRTTPSPFVPPIWDGKQVAGGTYERGE